MIFGDWRMNFDDSKAQSKLEKRPNVIGQKREFRDTRFLCWVVAFCGVRSLRIKGARQDVCSFM